MVRQMTATAKAQHLMPRSAPCLQRSLGLHARTNSAYEVLRSLWLLTVQADVFLSC